MPNVCMYVCHHMAGTGMAKPVTLVAVWVAAAFALQHATQPVLATSPHAAPLLSLLQICACACAHVGVAVLSHPGVQSRWSTLVALLTRPPDRLVLLASVGFLVCTFCTNASAASSTLYAAQCIRAMEPAIVAVLPFRSGNDGTVVSRAKEASWAVLLACAALLASSIRGSGVSLLSVALALAANLGNSRCNLIPVTKQPELPEATCCSGNCDTSRAAFHSNLDFTDNCATDNDVSTPKLPHATLTNPDDCAPAMLLARVSVWAACTAGVYLVISASIDPAAVRIGIQAALSANGFAAALCFAVCQVTCTHVQTLGSSSAVVHASLNLTKHVPVILWCLYIEQLPSAYILWPSILVMCVALCQLTWLQLESPRPAGELLGSEPSRILTGSRLTSVYLVCSGLLLSHALLAMAGVGAGGSANSWSPIPQQHWVSTLNLQLPPANATLDNTFNAFNNLSASVLPLVTIHAVSLATSPDRWVVLSAAAAAAGVQVERSEAVDSRNMTRQEAIALNVTPATYDNQRRSKRMGAIGCYLSHRSLLLHLSHLQANREAVHLILEDDAILPVDLLQRWEEVAAELASLGRDAWDMVTLAVYSPKLQTVSGMTRLHAIQHPKSGQNKGNYGTHAYAVRHGSLPRINAVIAIMTKAIDNAFNELDMAGAIRRYIVSPSMFEQSSGSCTDASTTKNKRERPTDRCMAILQKLQQKLDAEAAHGTALNAIRSVPKSGSTLPLPASQTPART